MKFVVSVLVIASLSLGVVRAAFWFGKEKKPPLEGTLRCYQCDTKIEKEQKLAMPVCKMDRWKLANSSEKRNMMTHCPRRMSSYCMLVVHKDRTIRGCYGLRYKDGSRPHYGCFRMGEDDPKRVCLCNSDLCNAAGRSTGGRCLVGALVLVVLILSAQFIKIK